MHPDPRLPRSFARPLRRMPAIVLDLPEPAAEYVRDARRRFGSWRVAIPAEICVAGSSGLGELDYGPADAEHVYRTVGALAAAIEPVRTRFSAVDRFAGTNVFHFTVEEPSPFAALQARLADSGLRFFASPHPFTPHCTIADPRAPSPELVREVLSLPPPPGEITLRTLSIYALDERVFRGDPRGCRRLFSAPLGG